MAKKQKIDITEKSVHALKEDVEEAKKELFNLHLDNKMRKLKNTRSIFLKRKEIAKMLTAMKMKQLDKPTVAKAMAGKKEVVNG